MTTPETCRYRGYDIVSDRQWSRWCVSVYATRADLPRFPDLLCVPWHCGRKRPWPRPSSALTWLLNAEIVGPAKSGVKVTVGIGTA